MSDGKKELGFEPQSAADWPRFMLDTFTYFYGQRAAIPHLFVEGRSKLTVIVGENAAGKSFARRLITLMARDIGVECMHLSMEGRSAGTFSMMAAVMIYGSEQYHATGSNSAHVIQTGIRNSLERKNAHVLFWDEPDVGLSDGAAAGAGQAISAYAKQTWDRKRVQAVFVTTHNRHLVRELLPARPNYLHLGLKSRDAPPTLADWCDRPVVPIALDTLRDANRERFKRIQRILDRGPKRRKPS